MPFWRPSPASAEPKLQLVRWRVFETERNERHFVGFVVDHGVGRVSSPIQSFDAAARSGVTHSGRVYELVGPPGYDSDAEYVWSVWVQGYQVAASRDVTAEYANNLGEPSNEAQGVTR